MTPEGPRIEPVVPPGEPEALTEDQQVAAEPAPPPQPATATGDILAEAVGLVDELLGLGMPLHPLERRIVAPALATVAPAAEQLGSELAPVPYPWPRLILGGLVIVGRRVLAAWANAEAQRAAQERLAASEAPRPQATLPATFAAGTDPREDPNFISEDVP